MVWVVAVLGELSLNESWIFAIDLVAASHVFNTVSTSCEGMRWA